MNYDLNTDQNDDDYYAFLNVPRNVRLVRFWFCFFILVFIDFFRQLLMKYEIPFDYLVVNFIRISTRIQR